jgi:hypothetical protein
VRNVTPRRRCFAYKCTAGLSSQTNSGDHTMRVNRGTSSHMSVLTGFGPTVSRRIHHEPLMCREFQVFVGRASRLSPAQLPEECISKKQHAMRYVIDFQLVQTRPPTQETVSHGIFPKRYKQSLALKRPKLPSLCEQAPPISCAKCANLIMLGSARRDVTPERRTSQARNLCPCAPTSAPAPRISRYIGVKHGLPT